MLPSCTFVCLCVLLLVLFPVCLTASLFVPCFGLQLRHLIRTRPSTPVATPNQPGRSSIQWPLRRSSHELPRADTPRQLLSLRAHSSALSIKRSCRQLMAIVPQCHHADALSLDQTQPASHSTSSLTSGIICITLQKGSRLVMNWHSTVRHEHALASYSMAVNRTGWCRSS